MSSLISEKKKKTKLLYAADLIGTFKGFGVRGWNEMTVRDITDHTE